MLGETGGELSLEHTKQGSMMSLCTDGWLVFSTVSEGRLLLVVAEEF